MSPEIPPSLGTSLLKRAGIAALAIVLLTAGSVSAAAFLMLDDFRDEFVEAGEGRAPIVVEDIDRGEAGEARTILVIGSDKRAGVESYLKPRSDTLLLARLDPDKDAITLMSIPRDFRVEDPHWSAYPDRINAAFSNGGANSVVKTVKRLLSSPERPFKIHHVVQVDFAGFRRFIDYLDCVYVDIDRRYFNDRGGPGGYATIDVQPGYQKLCGRDSLDYVRYRHTDNDIARAARQQDFLRQLKDQDTVRARLNLGARKEIARLLGRYTDTDKALRNTSTLLSLLKLGIYVAKNPIQEVAFGDGRLEELNGGAYYLTASRDALEDTVDNFLNAETIKKPRGGRLTEKATKRAAPRRARRRGGGVPGLVEARAEGEDRAIVAQRKIDFPFYFPRLRHALGTYVPGPPRTYRIKDATGKKHDAYRLVLTRQGEYYGVQGLTWKDPPILDGPHDTLKRNGRELHVYYDGKRVRLVSWRTRNGVYYVHNTLLRTLDYRQMVAMAASLTRLGAR